MNLYRVCWIESLHRIYKWSNTIFNRTQITAIDFGSKKGTAFDGIQSNIVKVCMFSKTFCNLYLSVYLQVCNSL